MGSSRYEHPTIHHQNFHHKTIYLPMFCRLSIKDIKVNNSYKDRTSLEEPSSPQVSCIGQVKRSNRVIGFPTAAAAATPTATTNHQKYPKLKKLFSSKTLLPTTINTSNGGARRGSRSCRFVATNGASRCVNINSRRLKFRNDGDQDCVKVVNISELDPPLPVVKRVAAPPGVGRDEVNIWKRRFNGVTLDSLQIEQIRLPNNKFQPPPTV